jgi:hypothetical protein
MIIDKGGNGEFKNGKSERNQEYGYGGVLIDRNIGKNEY